MTDRDPSTGRFCNGNRANPNGRPRSDLSIIALIDECVTPEDWRAILDRLKSLALRGNIKAIELLADRRFGKALQQTDTTLHGEMELLVWDIQPPAKRE